MKEERKIMNLRKKIRKVIREAVNDVITVQHSVYGTNPRRISKVAKDLGLKIKFSEGDPDLKWRGTPEEDDDSYDAYYEVTGNRETIKKFYMKLYKLSSKQAEREIEDDESSD